MLNWRRKPWSQIDELKKVYITQQKDKQIIEYKAKEQKKNKHVQEVNMGRKEFNRIVKLA